MVDKIGKFIHSLDSKTRQRLKNLLKEVRENPFGVPGVKKLTGWGPPAYRVRLGKIRIIYRVQGDHAVEIVDIDYRDRIY